MMQKKRKRVLFFCVAFSYVLGLEDAVYFVRWVLSSEEKEGVAKG